MPFGTNTKITEVSVLRQNDSSMNQRVCSKPTKSSAGVNRKYKENINKDKVIIF